jgi:hypothetical protein
LPPRTLTYDQVLQIAIYTAVFTAILTLFAHWFKNKFDFWVDSKKFKREIANTRLSELYLHLYAVIAQSEYVRKFHNVNGTHKEIPFLEISKTKKNIKKDFFSEKVIESTEEIKVDAITAFNKMKLFNQIIEKGQFSSQKLLKLAVSYRYVYEHYLDDTISNVDRFRDEELILIWEIVSNSVKETNEYLKLCAMEYNKIEKKTGIMQMFNEVKKP